MDKKEVGYVQIYTGDGKGKTSAAIGLIVRALGAGKKVFLLQFMKQLNSSEHKILTAISSNLHLVAVGKPYFLMRNDIVPQVGPQEIPVHSFEPGQLPAEYLKEMDKGLSFAEQALTNCYYDLVVLDELCVAINLGLIDLQQVLCTLNKRRKSIEVVITGRGAPGALVSAADLVTEMVEVKHYYNRGVQARIGIEY